MKLQNHIAKGHGYKEGSNVDHFCKQSLSIILLSSVVSVGVGGEGSPIEVSLGENGRSERRDSDNMFCYEEMQRTGIGGSQEWSF